MGPLKCACMHTYPPFLYFVSCQIIPLLVYYLAIFGKIKQFQSFQLIDSNSFGYLLFLVEAFHFGGLRRLVLLITFSGLPNLLLSKLVKGV